MTVSDPAARRASSVDLNASSGLTAAATFEEGAQ